MAYDIVLCLLSGVSSLNCAISSYSQCRVNAFTLYQLKIILIDSIIDIWLPYEFILKVVNLNL